MSNKQLIGRIRLFYLAFVVFSAPVFATEPTLSDTIVKIKPSIVGVATYKPTRRPPVRLMGTGFVVGDGHHVATNAHVVSNPLDEDGLEQLAVLYGTGSRPRVIPAKLALSNNDRDVALLKISEHLDPLTLDIIGPVREGEVYAFTGYPIGAVLGLYPVTHRGMVSSITPIAIPSPSSSSLSATKIRRLRDPLMAYQLDAIAYPGNSGSPLYRTDSGAVVGILNQVYVKATKEDVLSNPSGISYAVPVKHLKALLDELQSQ